MKTLVDLKKEIWSKKKKYFENYLGYAREIKKEAQKLLGPGTRVLVFGSVSQGDYTPESDIDVLILSDRLSENWEENTIYKVKIRSKFGLGNPFQIHLARPREYENWFKKFIKDKYLEI